MVPNKSHETFSQRINLSWSTCFTITKYQGLGDLSTMKTGITTLEAVKTRSSIHSHSICWEACLCASRIAPQCNTHSQGDKCCVLISRKNLGETQTHSLCPTWFCCQDLITLELSHWQLNFNIWIVEDTWKLQQKSTEFQIFFSQLFLCLYLHLQLAAYDVSTLVLGIANPVL